MSATTKLPTDQASIGTWGAELNDFLSQALVGSTTANINNGLIKEDHAAATKGGKVGVGTATPTAKLHIKDTTNPVIIEGLGLGTSTDQLITIDSAGVLKKQPMTSTQATSTFGKFEQFSQRPTNLTTTDAGKTYLYTQTGNMHQWSGTAWNVLNESEINVKDYGAIGDGVTNDVAAINAAALLAKNGYQLIFPNGIFFIANRIFIKNGTKAVLGKGGIIKVATGVDIIGMSFESVFDGDPQNMKDCKIDGLIMDMSNSTNPVIAINLKNASNCIVSNNYIYNLSLKGAGISVSGRSGGGEACVNNQIVNNRIEGNTTNLVEYTAINVSSDINFSGFTEQNEHWKANFVTALPYFPNSSNIISGNIIKGGYYGIAIAGSNFTTVTNNNISFNIRNISCQNDCKYNNISNNNLSESFSSGVHLAYGSSYNLISNNKITTNRGSGEGLLQAYVASKFNKFSGNSISNLGASGNKFHIYTAVHSDGNEFSNNILNGSCSHAYIAVESAWKATGTEIESRAFGNGTLTDNFANTGMSGTVIKDNIIDGTSNVAGIYLAQWSDTGGTFPLSDVEVSGNIIKNNIHNYQIKLFENTSGNLKDLVLKGNSFDKAVTSNKFLFPRGRSHFENISNNSFINDSYQTLTTNSATPSVIFGNLLGCANTVATSITNFLGGKDGDEITIRLDIFTTIVSNPNIKLKGGINITGVNSNNLVTFVNISGIWFETSRNF